MQSYINPLAEWRGPVPISNDDVDRIEGGISHSMAWAADDPSWIVLHTEVGNNAAAEDRFKNGSTEVSAHYGVGWDGHIVQWVDEKDGAYCDGNFHYNNNGIGIEHEDNGDYNGPRSDALYEASARLVRDICTRYGIPITRQWIIKHNEVPGSSTGCPDALDVDRIVAMAAGTWNGPAAPVVPVEEIIPVAPVVGVVYDTADNDRSFLDYNTITYVSDHIADVGTSVTWIKAKLVTDPAHGGQKWLLGLSGAWALWDDCVDDTDATHDAAHSSPPDFAAKPTPPVIPPVEPPVVEPPKPPVDPVLPPVLPPVVDPPVIKPPVQPPVVVKQSFWEMFIAWLVKLFTGK